jgi:DNA-directed RNA polymerases I, II, and III subunit RPABC5
MIIPMRCVTCNKCLSDKWVAYINNVQAEKTSSSDKLDDTLELCYLDISNSDPKISIEGKVLTDLGIHKYCCRRMMLTNVHMISYTS